MVQDFYGRMGFSKVRETEDGSTEWSLELQDYDPRKPAIEIIR